MKSKKAGNPASRSALKAQIDDNLRKVYEAALNEEVPDRFKDLLEKLKAKETP
ncbi:NepR family anti-sigma factor [Falsigemmobacter intermedius]|uniref:Transcriptional regulator n=1 Tax=Falsigemmobacter intermedius TaxID=1553448 RepID=A0A444ME37_9RHOB|nr:NepR family anti-sigma factor [Falsigemmobacter intermedius]RWY43081.1 transcriptional regulator [Falsigemmobacter intermedius]